MRRATLSLVVVLFAASVAAGSDLKSGPQVGQGRAAFHAHFANGIHAGKAGCPV